MNDSDPVAKKHNEPHARTDAAAHHWCGHLVRPMAGLVNTGEALDVCCGCLATRLSEADPHAGKQPPGMPPPPTEEEALAPLPPLDEDE